MSFLIEFAEKGFIVHAVWRRLKLQKLDLSKYLKN